MTTAIQKRTIFDALLFEPLELAISQPPQLLISAASVFLVGAEAGILIDAPWNVLLAVGAEWAYLRGLCSGQAAKTRWAAGLIWSAVILVIAYGSLWGLRRFGLIPDAPPAWAAVVLTALHIGCISAVTLCSAMCHRAELIARRVEEERTATEVHERRRLEDEADRARQIRIQQEQDLIELDTQRKRAELALWEEGQAAKMRAHDARAKMRTNARPARVNAEAGKCPKCKAELTQAQWLAACRWGHCSNCKEA